MNMAYLLVIKHDAKEMVPQSFTKLSYNTFGCTENVRKTIYKKINNDLENGK